MNELWTTRDVAKILNVSTKTVERWRHDNRGPAYIRIEGTVRYPKDDLEIYLTRCRALGAIDRAGRA